MSNRVRALAGGVAALLVVAGGVVVLASGSDDGQPNRSDGRAAPSTTTTVVTIASDDTTPTRRASDLPTIRLSELPPEAVEVLALVAQEGPFPYPQDDSVFQNREGLLPDRPDGHYREYTVDTPGASDRGARRLVIGAEGARYYTDDHYESFREVVDG